MSLEAPGGTVTILFTDVVGSTRLLSRLGEDAADDLRRRHFGALREEIARHGGHEVKTLGDGLMVAFASAADALGCAVEMQRRTAAEHDGLQLRVGLHAGEPSREGDDYFGTPVVVARRLCDRARGREILTSELVRGLVGRRGEHRFTRLGPLELKGLEDRVDACSVRWDGSETESDAFPATGWATERPPLPPGLTTRPATRMIGRGEPLVRLRAALAAARDGAVRVVTLCGEPGIGKTRLAAEFAAEAHASGATVLFGRADEDALMPYQPLAEALRRYLADVPAAREAAARLAPLVPELGAGPPGREEDPTVQRYLLFEAVAWFLGGVGRSGPVVLVLDDLHWADAPTLQLVRHLARPEVELPLLILGTYRDTDLARSHPLADALAEMRRERLVERVLLGGLSQEEVSALLAEAAGHHVPASFSGALFEETEGNPFFLEEVLRHLVETGAVFRRDGRWTSDKPVESMGIPEGVREAVGRRLARLSGACNQALAAASVLGRAWEFDILRDLSGLDEDALLDALEEALAAQLVVESADAGRPAYAFTHALVRQTLYEELSLARRQRMHLRAADAIETARARQLDEHTATLALHLRQAGAAADPGRALEWTLRAGSQAAAALAWEEAETHLSAALELMEDIGTPPAERARLLERLADLKYVVGVDLAGAIRYLEEALAAYESADDPVRLARVHVRLARDRSTFWGPSQDVRRAAEHIAAADELLVPADQSGSAGIVLDIVRATVATWSNDIAMTTDTSARAVAKAERIRNRGLWANAACLQGNMIFGQGELARGKEMLEQAWQTADELNHPWVAFLATWCLAGISFWVTGPEEGLRTIGRELEKPRIAGAAGQKRFLWGFLTYSLLTVGRTQEARAAYDKGRWITPTLPDIAMPALIQGPAVAIPVLEESLREARRAGNHWWEGMMLVERARLESAMADPAAHATIAAALAHIDSRPIVQAVQGLHIWATAAQLAVERGDLDGARAHLARAAELVDGREDWGYVPGLLDAAAAELAARDGRTDEAAARFDAAAGRLLDRQMVFAAADVIHRAGVALRDPERLERAAELYDRHGAASFWPERSQGERARLRPAARA